MKVGQQIQVRMEQLGVSVAELAKRTGVSGQAVRHWISGRSFPGKRHAPVLEQALSFTLDYSEGAAQKSGRETATAMMDRHDIELMLMISRLAPELRIALRHLVEASLSTGLRSGSFSERMRPEPVDSFFETSGEKKGVKRSRSRASGG